MAKANLKAIQAKQKADEARHRKDFIARLRDYCDRLAGPGIFHLIPEKELHRLYVIRYRPVRVLAGPDQDFSASFFEHPQSFVNAILQNETIALDIGQVKEISLYDYFTLYFTLMTYANRLKEDAYPNAAVVKTALAPLVGEDKASYIQAWAEFRNMMRTLPILFYSDLTAHLFVMQLSLKNTNKPGLYIAMEFFAFPAEKIQVKIEGSNRPVYRLAWGMAEPDVHLDYIAVDAAALGLPGKECFPVYLQSHALNRLSERMDGVSRSLLHYFIWDSFASLIVCRNQEGALLFEYRLGGLKTGYFLGDIEDGRLILRTFLFLTNNGTPEGEKLYHNMGLRKADKDYLRIDKLSTFLNSDIAHNQQLKEMFTEAGCESLLLLDKSIYILPDGSNEKPLADLFVKYLGLG